MIVAVEVVMIDLRCESDEARLDIENNLIRIPRTPYFDQISDAPHNVKSI